MADLMGIARALQRTDRRSVTASNTRRKKRALSAERTIISLQNRAALRF